MASNILNFVSTIFPIVLSILVFSILVIVHEFGHFILAKKNGIKVEEFAVGMGPLVFSKQRGETLYSVRAFPIGGFCRMLGEDDGCTDKQSFNNKGVLAKISVVVAGPFMNFIFAFILMFILLCSDGFVSPIVSNLSEGYPGAEAGIMEGDRIVSIDGQRISVYQDLQLIMMVNKGEEINVVVERNGEKHSFNVIPKLSPETGTYIIGFTPTGSLGMFAKDVEGFEHANFFETIVMSFKTVVYSVKSAVVGFVRIFTFNVSKDEISGPIGIIKVIGDSYEVGLKESLWMAIKNMMYLAAFLSANLGALNLFPIPAMDGGRLVFLFIEGIRGKPINPEKEGMVHFMGFVLLMAFMVFIAYNDISRLILS